MKFANRTLQLQILEVLVAAFPEQIDVGSSPLCEADPMDLLFNMAYLDEHGLIEAPVERLLGAPQPTIPFARATARGVDFLEEDGGLGAILNVLTVRLEAQTIKSLIADKVSNSELPAEEKSRIMSALRSAGSELVSETTTRLVSAALDQAPGALQLLRTLLA